MKQEAREGLVDPNIAVQLRGIVKTYPGKTKGFCQSCRRASPYHALKVSIYMSYPRSNKLTVIYLLLRGQSDFTRQ